VQLSQIQAERIKLRLDAMKKAGTSTTTSEPASTPATHAR
jgi:hypothetical protein